MSIEKTATDYAKYLEVDLPSKVQPLYTSIDEMLARLEEFQTMLCFITQDRKDYSDIITSIPNYKAEFDDLCKKIDVLEVLVAHIKDNLDTLENKIEKAEIELNMNESTMKVPSIFTPLFKKNTTPDRGSSKDSANVQEYKEELKTQAEQLVLKGFPETIVKLNQILETSQFKNPCLTDIHQDLNIPVPDPIVLNSHTDLPASKRQNWMKGSAMWAPR